MINPGDNSYRPIGSFVSSVGSYALNAKKQAINAFNFILAKSLPPAKGLVHHIFRKETQPSEPIKTLFEQRLNVSAIPLTDSLKAELQKAALHEHMLESHPFFRKGLPEEEAKKELLSLSEKANRWLLIENEKKEIFVLVKVINKDNTLSLEKRWISPRTEFSIESLYKTLNEFGIEDPDVVYQRVVDKHDELLNSRPMIGRENGSYLTELAFFTIGEKITLQGLNIVLDEFKKKSPEMNCYVCSSYKEMQQAFENIDKSNFEGKIAFLVQHDSGHISPLLIQREKNEDGTFSMKIMVMDSKGTQGAIYPQLEESKAIFTPNGEELKKILKDEPTITDTHYSFSIYVKLKQMSLNSEPVFYFALPNRQNSSTDCPIFSMNDVGQFFKNSSFFAEIDKNGQVDVRHHGKVRFVQNLPPENMKMTQSVKQFEKYLQENNKESNKPFYNIESTSVKHRPINEALEKSLHYSPKRKKFINTKARDRTTKYLRLINRVIEETPNDEELKSKARKYDSYHLTVDALNGLKRQA